MFRRTKCGKYRKLLKVDKHSVSDESANTLLQIKLDSVDYELWDAMEQAAFEVVEKGLAPEKDHVEYWIDSKIKWSKQRPSADQLRIAPGLVHESSTLWMGKDKSDSVVGFDYRLHNGPENVYITGGSLWPTGGSWNPTLTMCGLAQHLADNLLKNTRPAHSGSST